MPAWPGTLPQLVESDGYTETALNGLLRSSMDSGPAKRRSRFTKIPKYVSFTLAPLTSTQVDALYTFYDTTCSEGALSFTWVHPRTGSAVTFAWMGERPATTLWNGTAVFQAAMQLEIVS